MLLQTNRNPVSPTSEEFKYIRRLSKVFVCLCSSPVDAAVVVARGLEAQDGENGNGSVERRGAVNASNQHSVSLTVIPVGSTHRDRCYKGLSIIMYYNDAYNYS